jgi:hypothetical protein
MTLTRALLLCCNAGGILMSLAMTTREIVSSVTVAQGLSRGAASSNATNGTITPSAGHTRESSSLIARQHEALIKIGFGISAS